MPANKISLASAKENKLFYVVATAVIYRESDRRCLILQRHKQEKVHPSRWGVVGGKLEWEDLDLTQPSRTNGDVLDFEGAIEDLIAREAKEEAGVAIAKTLKFLSSLVFVRPDGIPVVLLKYVATYHSGDVTVEEQAFEDFAWVDAEEVQSYDCIDGIAEEVAAAIALFKEES